MDHLKGQRVSSCRKGVILVGMTTTGQIILKRLRGR